MKSILDRSFEYRNSSATDVRITWQKEIDRIQAEKDAVIQKQDEKLLRVVNLLKRAA